MSDPRDTKEAAAYWAMKLAEGDCGPADRATFETWRRESAEHAQAYARAQRALAAVDAHGIHPEIVALGERVMAATATRRRLGARQLAWAASVIAVTVGAALLLQTFYPPAAREGPRAANTYETVIGERSTVRLADGSSIILNTDTRVELDFTSARRGLRLVRGQAWFDVAHESARPFVVEAGDRRIVALGTAFDVRVDAQDRVQVTLVEGRVNVDEIRASPRRAASLEPGQKLVATPGKPAAVTRVDVESITSWREGRLVFRNDRLADVVAEMNRYSSVQLEVAHDPALLDLRISGVFDTGSTASFLLALETRHGIAVQTLSEKRMLIVR